MPSVTTSNTVDAFMQAPSAATARGAIGLGTASTANVPATGNAGATEVVKGNDTRLSDSRTPTAHTHTAENVTDFSTAADARITAAKGAASGVCPLGADSKVASTYLPSYVDDVLEFANLAGLPVSGETGKIYVTLDSNKTYRWSGSAYIEISPTATHASSHAAGGTDPITVALASQVSGTLPVTSGGTGVAISSGANSVVLRDANQNIAVNYVVEGLSSIAASGTQVVLTVSSAPIQVVNGSGGQTIKLPDATTLQNGVIYTFSNNQSSGVANVINVNNSLNTLVTSIPAGNSATVRLLSNAAAAGVWGQTNQTAVETFTSSGTWIKPAGARAVDVVVISAGGGGGSGRKAGVSSQASGGGGGGGGSYSIRNISAALLGATETVTVGSGGTGGASVTANSTNGNIGVNGGNSSFGTWIQVTGGGGAGAATNTSGPAGSGSSSRAMFQGGNGSAGGGGAGALTGGSNVNVSSAGGGAGGGLPVAATVGFIGSTGGTALGSWFSGGTASAGAIGGNGGSAPNVAAGFAASGSAGGGGGSSFTGNAGNGGNGGLYGGAGGGGGASLDSVGNSGAGGNGADGIVVITTYF